ncbi:MAG TPA: Asp-tRNA(Asn)/Glu-tRNA(Gln) amidotransferase subunit GatB [Acidimicrobiia bacterium]|nr:Asp-tRNA(Asn)/Glu-tRNA(Gln) amidotransferase subunit GatB [Acidimicrobiia bacterium]
MDMTAPDTQKWEAVIGIEVHVELRTASKMFCGCPVSFGAEPNTSICPVCLGLPGALPVTNVTAIEWLEMIGLALNCSIATHSVFHRKNYFYADLTKNYQISQFDLPVCTDGWLELGVDGKQVRVGIERAHMEEDTGKSLHQGQGGRIHSATSTLLDFNRSGVPLVEIVSRPDLRTAAQARAYAQELRAVVAELGVSDARMEEGSIRFDANVSIRPRGEPVYGVKIEIKNMNSFRSLEKAIASEITRQIQFVEGGGVLTQETRHWDEEAGTTRGMRSKEGSSDYRYFTEPDLVPMEFPTDEVEKLRAGLPELPAQRQLRFASLGLDDQLAAVLSGSEPGARRIFDEAVAMGADPVLAANWMTGDITAAVRKLEVAVDALPLSGSDLAELIGLVVEGRVSSSAAKEVLAGVLSGEGKPTQVAEARDLIQVSDEAYIAAAVGEILAANPDAIERFRGGEDKVLGFLVGQVMRSTGGKADPKLVNSLLRQRLS